MSRYKWGNLTTSEPSRFIEEIDPKYLEMPAQNERAAFRVQAVRATDVPSLGQQDATTSTDDQESSKPVYGRERKAPGVGTPKPATPFARRPARKSRRTRKNLKRVSSSGKPLEATRNLGRPARTWRRV